MINITVRFGGKKGKCLWKLEESSNLLAVRTKTRQPLARVRFKEAAHRALLDFDCEFAAPAAGVEVLDVVNLKARNGLRKSMSSEPDIQFAGRVLRSSDSGTPVLYTENLFVKLSDGSGEKVCRELMEKHGLEITRSLGFAKNAFFVKAPEGCGLKIFEYQDQLFSDNAVEYCHPELVMEKSQRAANPKQWHLKRALIGGHTIDQHASVEAAWALSVGRDITIAIIDDGFDLGHTEFASSGKVVFPRDVTRQSDDPRPGAGDHHGTACAGVACADGVGSPGASGVAPAARLMPIRNASLLGSMEEAEAFYHAADKGADVISCSWGPQDGDWQDPTDPLHKADVPLPDSTRLAIDYCIENGRNGKGCIITWAAGNGNESADKDGYASYEKVICVAACNDRGKKSGYSDRGKSVWCAFPSSELLNSLTPGIWTVDRRGAAGYNQGFPQLGDSAGNYTNDFGGTSSACPGAAGVAALVLSVNPNLRWDQVRQILADTADKIDTSGGDYDDGTGHSEIYGHGRLNAKQAVEKAISMGGAANPAQPKSSLTPSEEEKPTEGASGGLELINQFLALQQKQADNFQELLRIVNRIEESSKRTTVAAHGHPGEGGIPVRGRANQGGNMSAADAVISALNDAVGPVFGIFDSVTGLGINTNSKWSSLANRIRSKRGSFTLNGSQTQSELPSPPRDTVSALIGVVESHS